MTTSASYRADIGRRRHHVRSATALAAIVALAACGSEAGERPGAVEVGSTDAPLPVLDLSIAPIPDAADPADRAGAAADLVDCEHGLWQGGWSADFGPLGSGPDPDAAVEALIGDGLLALPRTGFVAVGTDQHRVAYTHAVAGRPKAAVIVADSTEIPLGGDDRWVVEVFASCDPAEFDPSFDAHSPIQIWLDRDGDRVPSSIVRSGHGPDHCDWESVTFLSLDGVQYVADPDDVLGDVGLVTPYDGDAELPADASDSGYRRDGRALWRSADRRVAYVVADGRVEAWPSATGEIVCA